MTTSSIRHRKLHPNISHRRCSTRNFIIGCVAMIGFLHVYLVAKMTFRNANSSTNSSYQSKSMDNFRRIKKGAAIDFPELEENTQDVAVDIKSGRAQVDAEAKEEFILPNAVKVQIIEEKESSSLPKATIAYGKWICESTAANCIT